jgi:hypothetical protein
MRARHGVPLRAGFFCVFFCRYFFLFIKRFWYILFDSYIYNLKGEVV